jgi:hypothetical protein
MSDKIKKSYGIICFKKHPKNGIKILLVKKPYTYSFSDFILGKYFKNNDSQLLKLFNNMTYHEKMDILSLNFSLMWYRIYRNTNEYVFNQSLTGQSQLYTQKKIKFEQCFLQDRGVRLKRLINNSINSEPIWEIPKGKKNADDIDDINSAMREFSEESMIKKEQYKILWDIKPYIETYTDFGRTYQSIFYFAESVGDWEPVINFNCLEQVSEVADIRWCCKNDLITLKVEKNTFNRLNKLFDKVIKKYKNSIKLYNNI